MLCACVRNRESRALLVTDILFGPAPIAETLGVYVVVELQDTLAGLVVPSTTPEADLD
jgi:hypothetical protein